MKIRSIRALNGPNVYHHRPVLVTQLDLEDLAETASSDLPGFNNRLISLLPGLAEHHCSPGRPGGFLERLARGTYFAHIVEHIAIELSGPAGVGVDYGKSIYGGEPGVYFVVVRYRNEAAMTHLIEQAVSIAEAMAKGGQPPAIEEVLARARELEEETRLGPSTQAIVDAATRRGIPWIRLNELNLIQFGYGKSRKLIQSTTSSITSDIAVDIAQDKDLTKNILHEAAIRVPRGMVAASEKEALEVLENIGGSVTVKPLDGNHGRGVSLNLTTREQVADAFRVASYFSRYVVVEEYFPGRDFRVVVVGGKFVAAAERAPASVVGDGNSSLSRLIELENEKPLRGEGHEKPLTKIKVDDVVLAWIKRQGIDLSQVVPAGQRVFLRQTANLSTGGTATDVTDQVHPQIRRMCERAARLVGLDICGIDLVIENIDRPVTEQRGGIIEVNAGPGIRMHQSPSCGRARDVGAAIIDMLFPGNSSGRIPIFSITGTNGKTTVTRLVEHVLREQGLCVGMTTTDGIYIDGEKIVGGDTTGPNSARTVLRDPAVEVAVLETARGGILRRGLGYDWADIAVLTNIQADHIGQDGIEEIDDIFRIKSLVAERVRPGGSLVLNADDPWLVRLADSLVGDSFERKVVFFSLKSDQTEVQKHVRQGRRAIYRKGEWICEFDGRTETGLAPINQIPCTFGGTAEFQVANILAATAALREFGVPGGQIMQIFGAVSPSENSGRLNVYRVGDGYVILDYGHNPDAFRAISSMLKSWRHGIVTGVVGVPGDRTDEVLRESARVAAQTFSRIFIREDRDLRDRPAGEASRVLHQEILRTNPEAVCIIELDEMKAMRRAIREMKAGEIVVCFYENLNEAEAVLRELSAFAVSEAPIAPVPGRAPALKEVG